MLMPIKIPEALPATKTLIEENIFVMTEKRALSQDIRPLHILLLNLMPTKVETETQLTRLLGNTPLQIELELLQTRSYTATHVEPGHMEHFYTTFDQIKDQHFDGLVITGAPVEQMDFEEVEYWEELCEIMNWSRTHVYSTFHICWAALAGLYYHYGIPKKDLPKKLFGVYPHHVERRSSILFRGFDDEFMVPHSRHTTVEREKIEQCPQLKILASSPQAGVYAISTEGGRQIFVTGHSEYDPLTLEREYRRDLDAGKPIQMPENYYPDNDDSKYPRVSWRSSANLLYANWINYIVYQTTPYNLDELQIVKEFSAQNDAKPHSDQDKQTA
jgi:homoserine O-succinyltransferase